MLHNVDTVGSFVIMANEVLKWLPLKDFLDSSNNRYVSVDNINQKNKFCIKPH
jgi:hypothetical protein